MVCASAAIQPPDSYVSTGRAPDNTQKAVAEIRQAERRRIPIEVALQTAAAYKQGAPVEITVRVTNLFTAPLVMNRRMLVNHPRLEGEIAFKIIGPDGKARPFQRLITPMAIHDDDFVLLPRGQSIQRTVDLGDLYDLKEKGAYQIQVLYRNDLDQPLGTLRAWKGAVASEASSLRIE